MITLLILSLIVAIAIFLFFHPMPKRREWLANEAAASAEPMVAFANQLAHDDKGWVQLAPYGDFPNVDKNGKAVIQRFGKSDAEAIVNEFGSLLNTPSRLLGLPWYVGHPDHPRFKAQYKDTKAYGRIKQLEAREDGLYANVKWSAAGKQLLDDEAFHGHSVNWSAVPGGNEGGKAIFRPIGLRSVGFTNEPQIPVIPASLANEAMWTVCPPWLLMLAGLPADATPSEEELKAAIEAKFAAAVPNEKPFEIILGEDKFVLMLANEAPADLAAKLAAMVTELANEKAGMVEALAKATKAGEALANERKARATMVVEKAVTEGRILTAQKEAKIEELANCGDEFQNLAGALLKTAPVVKTKAITQGLGGRNVELLANVRDRQAKLEAMLAARAEEFPNESYDARYAAVMESEAGKALLAQMQPTAA